MSWDAAGKFESLHAAASSERTMAGLLCDACESPDYPHRGSKDEREEGSRKKDMLLLLLMMMMMMRRRRSMGERVPEFYSREGR